MSSLSFIWGHLCYFQLIFRLTHLSSFRAILSSYRIILIIFRVFLSSFKPVLAYVVSFRLIWVHLDSLEFIKANLSSFRFIQTLLGLFRLIWAIWAGSSSIRLIKVHLNSIGRLFRLIWAHLGSSRLFQAYLSSFDCLCTHLDSLTLIWACSSSIRHIEVHLNSNRPLFRLIWARLGFLFRLIQAPFSLFRHIWEHCGLFKLIQVHLSSFRLFWVHSGSFSLI